MRLADAPLNLLLWCLCNVLLPGLHLPAKAGPGHPSVLLPLSAISLAPQLQVKQRLSNQQSHREPNLCLICHLSPTIQPCTPLQRSCTAVAQTHIP